jgi:WD40 repeat protein
MSGLNSDYIKAARIILNQLGRIRVQCSNCQQQLERGNFEQHKSSCLTPCPQGCGENVPQSKLIEHATVCLYVPVPCTAAEFGCTEAVLRGILHYHAQKCRYEQSRFIFEPLHQETLKLKRKYESEISSLTTKYNTLNNSHQRVLTEVGVMKNRYETLESKYEKILQQLANLTTKSRVDQLPSTVSKLMNPLVVSIEHLVCGSGRDIEIWNVRTGTCVKVLKGHRYIICSIFQLPDGTLVSASGDTTIRLWNIETGQCTKVHRGHTSIVNCVIQLANGTIASGSYDKTICIWNREQEVKTKQCGTWVQCLLELEDGTLVSSGDDNKITFWNVRSGEKIKTLTGHTSTVLSLVQLKDGRLVSASQDNTIRIWKNDKCEKVLKGHTNWVWKVIELTDGQLASCSEDNTIRLWNINTGECQVLTGHTKAVRSLVQISSDTIVSGSEDNTIRVWKNGKQIKQMECSGWVWSMAPIKLRT